MIPAGFNPLSVLVHRIGAKPLVISMMPTLQPQEDGVIHAYLTTERFTRAEPGLRRCVLRNGTWHDDSIVERRDDSWHPDLPDHLGEYVAVCRQVMQAIGRCDKITVMLEFLRIGSTETEFRSSAMFMETNQDGPGHFCGTIDEQTLDQIPLVRFVERRGIDFQDFLEIKGYDDASGFEGEFSLDVTPTSMRLFHEADEFELILSSVLADGSWLHTTDIRQTIYEKPDPIEMLRNTANPVPFGQATFHESHWAEIYNNVPDVIGFHTSTEDDRDRLTISYVAGTMLRAIDDPIAANG